jgi:D-alanine-D-alanine ligase
LNIILITGGPSAERDVALSSSRSILKSLRELGHNVKVIDPVYGEENTSEEKIFEDKVTREYPSTEKLLEIRRTADRNIIKCFDSDLFEGADMVFLGLHGKFGEDGKIQSLLDLRHLKYTGSDYFPSALAFNKEVSKILFANNNIPTPRWMYSISEQEALSEEFLKKLNKQLAFPIVVKPDDDGSSVGLTILRNENDYEAYSKAVQLAFKYSNKILFEKYIEGRELTVTILGNEAYPVIEIKPKDGIYDYEHKYTKGMTEYICPAQLSEEETKKVQAFAQAAYNALGCKVYARVDFIQSSFDKEFYCLEVNTLPGMTETSLVPKSAAAMGMSFTQLIEKLIELSFGKYK